MPMLTPRGIGLTSMDCLAEKQGEAILKSILALELPQPPCNDSRALRRYRLDCDAFKLGSLRLAHIAAATTK